LINHRYPAHPNPLITAEKLETPDMYAEESLWVFSLPHVGQEYWT